MVSATVSGGGKAGQAGAVRHGLSRALVKFDEEACKSVLKDYMEQDKKTPITLFRGEDVNLNFLFYNQRETILTERVAFVFAGVLIASAANRIILPYRLADENVELCGRYLGIVRDLIGRLGESLDGRQDRLAETALVLRASTVSSKIRTNVTGNPDLPTKVLLSRLDRLTVGIRLLSGSLTTAGSECRGIVGGMVSSFDPDSRDGVEAPDTSGLEPKEADMVRETAGILDGYLRGSALYDSMSSGARQL